ncbi:MAG: beta-propeller domain-containing protein [Clostridia bacterium]|nr:beta-propeller domain-containing protein [Clostridia bacterium]
MLKPKKPKIPEEVQAEIQAESPKMVVPLFPKFPIRLLIVLFLVAALLLPIWLLFQAPEDHTLLPKTADTYQKLYDALSERHRLCAPTQASDSALSAANGAPSSAESDVAKSNGNYVYSLSKSVVGGQSLTFLNISSVDENAQATLHSKTELSALLQAENKCLKAQEFYLYENKLIFLFPEEAKGTVAVKDREKTVLAIVDASNPAAPTLEKRLSQDGRFITAHMSADAFYLVTQLSIPYQNMNKRDPATFMPTYYNGEVVMKVPVERIFLPHVALGDTIPYTIVGSIDLGESSYKNCNATLGRTDAFCLCAGKLYLCVSQGRFALRFGKTGETSSTLISYELENAAVRRMAERQFSGKILNADALHVYNSTTLFAVANYEKGADTQSCIYALDLDLKTLSSTPGLGKTQKAVAVRFDKGLVYLLAKEAAEAFCCIDLTNPKKPLPLSEFLLSEATPRFYTLDENTLLGLGYADENADALTEGVKLSVFDAKSLTETQEFLFAEADNSRYVYSRAIDDPKAMLVSSEKNVACFVLQRGAASSPELAVLRKGTDGFTLDLIKTPEENFFSLEDPLYTYRAFCMDQTLCLVGERAMQTYSLETLEALSTLLY